LPSAALVPGSGATSVLDAHDVGRIVDRMAHQIIERTAKAGPGIALLGIPTRGVPLARRLAARVQAFEGPTIPLGQLDTTLYRDDLRLRGVRPLGETVEPAGGITDKLVILVDDVLYSIRDLGRPRAVQLAVLVDRGHRQLPIRADYVGKNLPTSNDETVRVLLSETDGADGVFIDGAAQ
jgi:pyrimidine operon attenuation protein/uracil phosphoribosyltransferase